MSGSFWRWPRRKTRDKKHTQYSHHIIHTICLHNLFFRCCFSHLFCRHTILVCIIMFFSFFLLLFFVLISFHFFFCFAIDPATKIINTIHFQIEWFFISVTHRKFASSRLMSPSHYCLPPIRSVFSLLLFLCVFFSSLPLLLFVTISIYCVVYNRRQLLTFTHFTRSHTTKIKARIVCRCRSHRHYVQSRTPWTVRRKKMTKKKYFFLLLVMQRNGKIENFQSQNVPSNFGNPFEICIDFDDKQIKFNKFELFYVFKLLKFRKKTLILITLKIDICAS